MLIKLVPKILMAYILICVILLIPQIHSLFVEGSYSQPGRINCPLGSPLKTWIFVLFLKTKDALEEYLKIK